MTLKGEMLTLIFQGHLIHFLMRLITKQTRWFPALSFQTWKLLKKLLCLKMQLLTFRDL